MLDNSTLYYHPTTACHCICYNYKDYKSLVCQDRYPEVGNFKTRGCCFGRWRRIAASFVVWRLPPPAIAPGGGRLAVGGTERVDEVRRMAESACCGDLLNREVRRAQQRGRRLQAERPIAVDLMAVGGDASGYADGESPAMAFVAERGKKLCCDWKGSLTLTVPH